MVSIEQSFDMFNRHIKIETDDYSRYPLPPGAVFGAPMEMMAPDSFATFTTPPHDYPFAAVAYDPSSLYAEGPNHIYNGRSSPAAHGDERGCSSTLSTASAPSAASSAVGSPQSIHGQLAGWAAAHTLNVSPNIVGQADHYSTGGNDCAAFTSMEEYPPYDIGGSKPPGFVDPSLIHPDINPSMPITFENPFQAASNPAYPTSPALSHAASSPQPMMRTGSHSPFLHSGFQQQPFSPYQTPIEAAGPRRASHPFVVSPGYAPEPAGAFSGDEAKEKSRCPHHDCGKSFKDLKAHMLTHQNERPEKCPIATCEYHVKGFSRKYDRNRHTLTHYKGTMVCGFCPGTGSAAEKSFNRADVFKRHLTAVHSVEQTPPNGRKKPPTGVMLGSAGLGGKKLAGGYPSDATGKCSTCSATFPNAQEFYEHLDDCVLRIVQQEDPAEAVNARRLAEVEHDTDVIHTLEKNNLPPVDAAAADGEGEDDDDEEMAAAPGNDDDAAEDAEEGAPLTRSSVGLKKKPQNPAGGVQKSRGMTYSRGGVTLQTRRGRKHRRDYPSSWGFDKGQMTMKKRVMAVFTGPRRLAKDDMMLSTEHEVRVSLGGDGRSYVTDLDVQTMKRAEGFLGATDEEKGPWVSDDPTEEELRQMREMLVVSETA